MKFTDWLILLFWVFISISAFVLIVSFYYTSGFALKVIGG